MVVVVVVCGRWWTGWQEVGVEGMDDCTFAGRLLNFNLVGMNISTKVWETCVLAWATDHGGVGVWVFGGLFSAVPSLRREIALKG